MKEIKNVKGYLTELFGNMSEEEILSHLGVDDFSELRVRSSSSITWMIERKIRGVYEPVQDQTAIEMQDEDSDFDIEAEEEE